MKKLKTSLIVVILIALPLALAGCGLVGALGTNKTEISSNMGEELPEWLTAAHRVQAVPLPVREPEEDESNQDPVTIPVIGQPASPQPSPTQPAPQPAPQPSGTPRWQQPGTMEYIAKLQLDQVAFNYKALNKKITDYDVNDTGNSAEGLKALKEDRADLYDIMNEVATGIGLSLEKEYGIKPPPATATTTDATDTTDTTWFLTP